MQHIQMTPHKFNVETLRDQLGLHPEVWNGIPHRTNFAGSPHREVDDIWVRYNALENYHRYGAERFNEPHTSEWYPVVERIPSAKILSLSLFHLLNGERLGGVLITRVPAGCQVYPHTDPGWHARFYDKYVVQVASAKGQAFCYGDGYFESEPGDCYWFDNAYPHWVVNNSAEERVSLIICIRRTPCH